MIKQKFESSDNVPMLFSLPKGVEKQYISGIWKRFSFSGYLGFLLLICTSFPLFSQDTTPPIITVEARDSAMTCNNSPLILTALTNWYNAAGYAMAEDDSGQFTWEANRTLQEVLTIFLSSGDTLCGNTRNVVVRFTAVDPSGNRSTPTTARFYTFDNTRPALVVPPNVTVSCGPDIRDTLIRWIRNKAGYIATDECSNILTWTRYQYSISQGNTIIQTGGGNINNGPYPTIPNGVCQWRMNINFWVVDECGNETVTFGTTAFHVVDNQAPVMVNPPADLTVSCDFVPPVPQVVFIDGCTFTPNIAFTEISSQDPDNMNCGHYQYLITRSWTATDACGNAITHVQRIQVADLLPPVIQAAQALQITCSTFKPDSSYYTSLTDACSPVIGFAIHREIGPVSCSYQAVFTYTFGDVCGNRDTFVQTIQIIADPIQWIKPPLNETYSCHDTEDFNGLFAAWLSRMADSEAKISCGNILSFAAVPGSYDPENPATFPGTHPGTLDAQVCPSPVNGFIRVEEVDFVYYTVCGNILVNKAVFGLTDNLAPVIQNCPSSVSIVLSSDECTGLITLPVPKVTDDCVEASSPIMRTVSAPVVSIDPANTDSPVHPVELRLGPLNPAGIFPNSDANIEIRFRRLDIDDGTEFFRIFDEDMNVLGRSPNALSECGDADMVLTLPMSRLTDWMSDGYISLHFIPNAVPGVPRAEINGFCGGSIQAIMTFDIDLDNAIFITYKVNQKTPVSIGPSDTLKIYLPPGNHLTSFEFSDCALNKSTCTTMIEVSDNTPPSMVCPSDKTIVLPTGTCSDTLFLDLHEITAFDYCEGNFLYNKKVPVSNEAALITFLYNDVTGRHVARNKQFLFNEIFPIIRKQSEIRLTAEFYGNNASAAEYFDILGPDGSAVGSTATRNSADSCGFTTTTFTIPQSLFNNWIFNGQISFTAVPNNVGNGINPCLPITQNQTTDGVSWLRLRLEYSDFAYAYQMDGATSSPLVNIPQDQSSIQIVLQDGLTNIDFFTGDANGNKGNCRFSVLMEDKTPPVARCKNAAVNIHPSGIENTSLSPVLIDDGSLDACSSITRVIEPAFVNCSQANSDVNALLIVIDEQGNRDSCTALIRVKPFELKPAYSSGLCENDTLKLFANLPVSMTPGAYTFHWKGPNNFEFFTENPTIPNVNESYNGLYSVTVTGFNQCITEGSVFVNIQPLTKPSLQSNQETLCEGENVILTTTQFTGNITYDWYEGIAPTGVKIATTQVPTLVINPLNGVHFYYIIASGENCTSTPSNLLKVTVIAKPSAMIEQLFYSACEGETITLRSTNTGNDLTYSWFGPGFSSTVKNPPPITNVSFGNQGVYHLLVSRGTCQSDTAKATVVILETPVKPIISSASVFCEGATFSLVVNNVNNGDRYEWYQNGILRFTSLDNNIVIPNVQPNFEGGWHVVVFKGTCPSVPSDIKSIAIDNLLEIGAANSGPICEGDSVQLQATFVPNATYRWESPDVSQNVPGIHNPKVLAKAGYYSVTITTPTGCKNNTGTVVEIITPPVITALSSDAESCMTGQKPITFSPSVFPPTGPYTYLWTSGSGFTSTMQNAVVNNPVQRDTGLYTLTVFFKGCPSRPFTIPVRFFMNPPKPQIVGQPFYCSGDSVILKSNVTMTGLNQKYIWNTPSFGQTVQPFPSFFAGIAAGTLNGIYTLTLEENGCRSESSDVYSLEVRQRPVLPGIRSNSPVCFGNAIQLEADFTDATYYWSGPDSFSSGLSMPEINNASPQKDGWYRLAVERNGCFSATADSIYVQVLPELSIPVITGQRYFLCQSPGSRVEVCIDPNSIRTGDVIALVNAATSDTLIKFTTPCVTIPSDLAGLINGSNILFAVVVNGNCTSFRSNAIVLEWDALPSFKAGILQGNRMQVCDGILVNIQALHGPPDVDISWFGLNPDIRFSNPDLPSTSVSGLSPGMNSIVLAYSYRGCTYFSTDTIIISVDSRPEALPDEFLLPFFTASTLDVVNNDLYSGGVTIRIVSPPTSGQAKVEGNHIIYEPEVSFTGETRMTYEICSRFCPGFCSTAEVVIRVDLEKNCRPPNIITPNEDGINDAFIVPCLYGQQYPGNSLVIFNEWGNEVYSAKNYNNDWQGLYNGSPLPGGTYYYFLDLGDGNKPLNGFLIIQR